MRTHEEVKYVALLCGSYVVDNDWTLQKIADQMGYPLSTVYYYIMVYLPVLDRRMYTKARRRLEAHKKHGRHPYRSNVGKDRLD